MADDDLNLDVGDGGDIGSPKKRGNVLGGLLPTLLKWVAIVVGAIILIVTVVVVTMQILNNNSPATTVVPISQQYEPKPPIYSWYQSLPDVRTRTNDPIPGSVIIHAALGYTPDDNTASIEITARTVEIQDYLRKYFSNKKLVEFKDEDALKLEIKNDINDILTQSSIKDVRFLTYDIIEQ